MASEYVKEAKNKMEKTIELFKKELSHMRTGRATPALLDGITVDVYGSQMPLNQVATVSAPQPRLLVVQPWDRNVIGDIEKAILAANVGLTPSNDGTLIRLQVPSLTDERRQDLIKVAKKVAEDSRIAIRNVRRELNDIIKKDQKEGLISEDDRDRELKELQKVTDEYTKKIDELLAEKEKEISSSD